MWTDADVLDPQCAQAAPSAAAPHPRRGSSYASLGNETPRRFTRGDQRVEILAVVEQWRTPDHRYFRVRTPEETCTLRQDVTSGGWELTGLGQSDPR